MESRKIRLLLELRSQGISDTQVLGAIEKVPREAFIENTFQDQAYENIALPIGSGQTISQPFVVATMTSALNVGPRMKVLEVGTGSGYQAAILSHLCRRIYTIERYRELSNYASIRFQKLRLSNIVQQVGDGNMGWHTQAPFNRIIITACAPEIPGPLVDQLQNDGVMVLPLLDSVTRNQNLMRISKNSKGQICEEKLMRVRFVPLLPGIAKVTNSK